MPVPVPEGVPQLPPGFVLGVATAAAQVEGAAAEDGRGPSVQDAYALVPGAIADGSRGAVADHYHRWGEDLDLLERLGVPSYRFSVSWSRVLPEGRGTVNQAGLDFYDRLVDRLCAAGISSMVTLHHHDLPQALEADGGWLNPATAVAFGEYAAVVAERLADRVDRWVPLSEPNVTALLGYAVGTQAPGLRLYFDALHVCHQLLLGHGRAVAALRAHGAREVGCANNHAPIWPFSDKPEDVGAGKLFDSVWNGSFLEPMLLGRYPTDVAPLMDDLVAPGDLATIRQPLDFYGVNYYSPIRVAAAPDDAPMPFEIFPMVGYPTTDRGWTVVPDALREWLITFRARFRAALPPIVITECGASYDVGPPDADGVVDDQVRIDYLDAHLRAVATACERGVDVRGFYVWGLLDGWEFAEGLRQQYGLVHVDPVTAERTPKRSFQWYADVVAGQPRSIG